MIIGYLRVSTGKQNPANQQDEIRRFADSRNLSVSQWVTEIASGKKKGVRPQIRGTDTAHETWRHADCHGNITPKPHADGPHGHHGQVSGEGNQPLHDQGGVFVR